MNEHVHSYQTKNPTQSYYRLGDLYIIHGIDLVSIQDVELYIVYFIHKAVLSIAAREHNFVYPDFSLKKVKDMVLTGRAKGLTSRLILHTADNQEALYIYFNFVNINVIIPLFIRKMGAVNNHVATLTKYLKVLINDSIPAHLIGTIGFKNVIYLPAMMTSSTSAKGALMSTTMLGYPLDIPLFEFKIIT